MQLKSLNIGTLSILLVATVGCATSGDLKRLEQESSVRQDQLRREFNLLREGVLRLQQDIQREREGNQSIRRDVSKTNQAVLLMGEAVAAIAQQLSASMGMEEKKAKPTP